MRMKTKTLNSIAALIAILVLLSFAVLAVPQGPTGIKEGTDERRAVSDSTEGTLKQAQAGNMTALILNSTRITSRWQGYYGNVTGEITLDDASNNSLYSWELITPQGEIYAVNHSTTPTWTEVACFNFTDDSQNVTLTELEDSLGITDQYDKEGVNETFNITYTDSFNVGSTAVSGTDCKIAGLFVNSAYDSLSFNETILHQNRSGEMVIYVSFVENSAAGFSGAPLDFQMIVGEDGDEDTAKNYYFYIELS